MAIVYLSIVSAWTFPDLWDAHFTLEYWQKLFQRESDLLGSLLLSIFISSVISIAASTFGFLISRELMFNQKKQRLIQLAFYPYLIAPVVLGAMMQFYFVRWNLAGTLMGVLLAQALFIFPYSVLLMSTFWTDRIRQIAFQASSLGASDWMVNKTILIPMARPWLLLSLVQCFLISWFEYGITQLIGVGKIETLTIKAMFYIKEASPHQAALAACLSVLPVIIILFINQQLIFKRRPA